MACALFSSDIILDVSLLFFFKFCYLILFFCLLLLLNQKEKQKIDFQNLLFQLFIICFPLNINKKRLF